MRILLDTNILIHREANRVVNEDIGILFGWFDKLHYEKCIHPLSLQEIQKHKDDRTVKTIETKIKNYNLLKTEAPETDEITKIREKFDSSDNDAIDTSLLKEVYAERVNYLITEDRDIHRKASELAISNLVFSIDSFLEKVSAENPSLTDYKTLSVSKEYFGNIDLNDHFFDSFRNDYQGFDKWFNSKSDEVAYVCRSDLGEMLAFLYIKIEDINENYSDIEPRFDSKKRLKIGTFKVISNGFKLGERFLKIVFDNSLRNRVDETYVTLFNYTEEQERLIGLLEDWGFQLHGLKHTPTGDEQVFIKDFHPVPDQAHPKQTYPFINKDRRYFIVPIYPPYHTELFPDSILNNESPDDFVENQPHRNAIQKVYISRSYFKDLHPGDIIIFYRTKTPGTNAYYTSVVTTIGVVDSVFNNVTNVGEFISLCRKRSVFTDSQLKEHWDYNQRNRPFIVNFLYLYSFPKRPNLKALIEMGVIADTSSVPRGFEEITKNQFEKIIEASETDESFIIN
jgi:predicted nucleic acid-binding protein